MLLAQGVATVVGVVSIYAIRNLSTSSWRHFSMVFALPGFLNRGRLRSS
jgi:hypothetical protein